jgi:hypothetical protein
VNERDTTIRNARGARPRPTLEGDAARGKWRGPILLVAAMVGWLFFVLALAAIVAPAGAGGGTTAQIGLGVTITAPGGWTSATDIWHVGPNATSLKKAGVLVAFAAEVYAGSSQSLLAEEDAHIGTQFDAYRALPVGTTTIAGDLPALIVLFSGTAKSSQLEGELVVAVASRSGTGVVMLAVAPAGQLRRVQGELNRMLRTMVVPR